MRCRYDRATMVQNYTRQVAAVISGKSSNDIVSDREYTNPTTTYKVVNC